uniref:hypothetical protein n=1 Tax=Paenibacillus zanthoxyli TaxID=369399 RepID=UPI0004708FCA
MGLDRRTIDGDMGSIQNFSFLTLKDKMFKQALSHTFLRHLGKYTAQGGDRGGGEQPSRSPHW